MLDLDLFKKSALAIAVAFALSACGGGGHGSSSNNGNDDPGNDDPDEPVVQVRKVTVSELKALTSAEEAEKTQQTNKIGCYDMKADEEKCKLVIYQVIPAVYDNGGDGDGWGTGWGPSAYKGTIGGLAGHLDYIKDLGVNALWVTPVFRTTPSDDATARKTDASGYFPSTHAEIDPFIGTDASFRDFVAAAHERKLQVILDGVFGHAKEDFVQPAVINAQVPPLVRKCIGDDGNLHDDCGNTRYFDWADHAAANEKYFSELAAYMITEYGIDGWRFDQAYQVPAASWQKIQAAINEAAEAKGVSGYTVAEIWDGGGSLIQQFAFNGNLDSSFNFPMRYSLMKVLASQEDAGPADAHGAAASTIETYGFNNMRQYAVAGKMYNSFTDNHDLVRFGDLIQRAGYTADGATADVVKNDEYQRRHKLSYIFLSQMSGPITIMYNQEIGDQVQGYVDKPSSCGTDKAYCDDHVSRTDAVYDTANLNSAQKKLRNYLKSLLKLRSEHRAMYYGSRYHVYSDAKTYIDLKISDDNDRVLFVMNTGTDDVEITLDEQGLGTICTTFPEMCPNGNAITLTNMLDESEVIVLDGNTAVPVEKLSGKLFSVMPGELQ